MIPEDLLQRFAFDGAEAHLALQILVGVASFAALLRRDALKASAARLAAAVAVAVVAVAALPIVDPAARLSPLVGMAGVGMVAASVPLWIELVSPALMIGLSTAAVVLHLMAALAAMGTVPPGSSWAGIVAVAGAAGAVLAGRAPGVLTSFVASGAAAWSLGLGQQPVAIAAAFALGLAVHELPRLISRFRPKEASYDVGR